MRLKNILNEMNFLIARCEAVSKVILFFQSLQFESTDTAKTPKSPEGDLKAAPSGEVWRGEMKVNLQFESSIY